MESGVKQGVRSLLPCRYLCSPGTERCSLGLCVHGGCREGKGSGGLGIGEVEMTVEYGREGG